MPKIQLFIATYNRPTLVGNAIQSALNQNFDSYEVIVSDNSTNDETEKLIYDIDETRIIYRKRTPSLSALDHFNLILSEVSTKYFLIFHDDDQMLPNMLSSLIHSIEKYNGEKIIAVGANAILAKNNVLTHKKFRNNIKKDIILENSTELARLYFIKGGIVPFTSYLYRKEIANEIRFDVKKGGKYSDVAFLLDVCNLGVVKNLEEPLMVLNQHDNQDSNDNIFEEKLKLIRYIVKTTNFSHNDKYIVNYRLYNIYSESCKLLNLNYNFFWNRRILKILMLFIKYNNYECFLKLFVKSFQYHLLGIYNKLKFLQNENRIL